MIGYCYYMGILERSIGVGDGFGISKLLVDVVHFFVLLVFSNFQTSKSKISKDKDKEEENKIRTKRL